MALEKIKRLKNIGEIEHIDKKSVFIGFSAFAENENRALEIVRERKKKYADATHNVYAYITDGGSVQRYSDDKEPQGTAGMPVLGAIRKSGITDICVVVTRYFGGILLGAGGLVRAYSTAASEAIEAGGIAVYEQYSVMRIVCSYSDYQKLLPELSAVGAKTDSVEYGSHVEVVFAVKEEISDLFCRRINEIFAGKLMPEKVGNRLDFE
ncbi:MAG: IMPACT family protein [Eubacteriales bacterium]